ncbi:2-dehydro-3-deoxygalactonokinase [Arcticibacterium luteifluviistationis]|uniref:2-keto-3-deoxy-galactonokinase n=1 Tax=Arcticibacterium luteifluviistationis TaxID=1784714 RepID=A0A2Z4GEB9_9BACT|nr:2-dehydro-3-deoxygalactonokinase [Arcticibacterium luteifluviistationis]AWV99596.1 hypothetical protein DJ013_16030 [Arcticibacterium luteifluviistationis]
MLDKKKIISCDWGTSSFRLRLVDVDTRTVLVEFKDSEGISVINKNWLSAQRPSTERKAFFLNILKEKIGALNAPDLAQVPVFISGMASSSIGIEALEYTQTPLFTNELNLVHVCFQDERDIYMFSGLRSETDVMRGEETMILGCDFEEEELMILPGTHSKHVEVKNGVIIDFKTFMTGEFFNILSKHSILADTIAKPESINLDNEFYQRGLKEGYHGNLLNLAFNTRTYGVLNNTSKENCYHYLSGLLIGTELKSVSPDVKCVHLISEGSLLEIYTEALKVLGISAEAKFTDANVAFVNGHVRLFKNLYKREIA